MPDNLKYCSTLTQCQNKLLGLQNEQTKTALVRKTSHHKFWSMDLFRLHFISALTWVQCKYYTAGFGAKCTTYTALHTCIHESARKLLDSATCCRTQKVICSRSQSSPVTRSRDFAEKESHVDDTLLKLSFLLNAKTKEHLVPKPLPDNLWSTAQYSPYSCWRVHQFYTSETVGNGRKFSIKSHSLIQMCRETFLPNHQQGGLCFEPALLSPGTYLKTSYTSYNEGLSNLVWKIRSLCIFSQSVGTASWFLSNCVTDVCRVRSAQVIVLTRSILKHSGKFIVDYKWLMIEVGWAYIEFVLWSSFRFHVFLWRAVSYSIFYKHDPSHHHAILSWITNRFSGMSRGRKCVVQYTKNASIK